MKLEDLGSAVDFKKWITVELQVILDTLKSSKNKIKFTTQTGFIEGEFERYEPQEIGQFSPLGLALGKVEQEKIVEIQDKEILNFNACIYLKNVRITTFVSPNSPILLDEFILFTDHISGLALSD